MPDMGNMDIRVHKADDLPGWNEPNLSPTEAKRQHFVPQMFLKPFAGTDGLLRVFDLESNNQFRTSPGNVAAESRFNDVEVDGTILSTEAWLSELEGAARPILEDLINDPDHVASLSVEEEMALAKFIAALRFRTPQFRVSNQAMMAHVVAQTKDMIKGAIFHQYGEQEAQVLWDAYNDQPDYKWLGGSEPPQPAGTSTFMLSEVQGWANLLWGAPWRVGKAPAKSRKLYTSDNPVAAYQRPVRPWWEGAAFASLTYFIPLAPDTLLKIERRPDGSDVSKPRGSRRRRDFSVEEISVARHLITRETTRFLYGEGLVVPRDCATKCLKMIDEAKVRFAVRYLGYDPRPPKGQGFPSK